MCGLVGYCGTNPNLDKIKLAMILQRSRGTDGCGVFYNNTVYKNKAVMDGDPIVFYKDYIIPTSSKLSCTTVIAHNRKKSSGSYRPDNSHPFLLEKNKKLSIVGSHNGTLSKKHLDQFCNDFKFKSTKFDVDSQCLLYALLLNHKRMDKVLSSYIGTAALAFKLSNEDNTLYLWRGASLKSNYTSTIEDERPLFYINYGTGIYYASEKSTLRAIANSDKKIYEVPENTLMKFKNGKLDKAIAIDRSNSYQDFYEKLNNKKNKKHNHYPYNRSNNRPGYTNYEDNYEEYNDFIQNKVSYNDFQLSFPDPVVRNLTKEGSVHEKGLRYYRNGHLVNGVFTLDSDGYTDLIKGKVFHFIDGYLLLSEKAYYELEGQKVNPLVHSKYISFSHTVFSKEYGGSNPSWIYSLSYSNGNSVMSAYSGKIQNMPFSFFDYTIKGGKLACIITRDSEKNNNEKLNNDDGEELYWEKEAVKEFNIFFDTDCENKQECEQVFEIISLNLLDNSVDYNWYLDPTDNYSNIDCDLNADNIEKENEEVVKN